MKHFISCGLLVTWKAGKKKPQAYAERLKLMKLVISGNYGGRREPSLMMLEMIELD